MANEPNLDHFLALLSEKDFPENAIHHLKENIDEFYWYLDEEKEGRAGEVVDAISQLEAERDQIFMSLVSLYPLSRSLILQILYGFPESDYGIIKGYDFEELMLHEITKFVDRVAEKRVKLTQYGNEYRKDIEDLQKRIQELETSAAKYGTLLQQKNELTEKRDQLERDIQEDKLNSDIAELQTDIERLKRQKQDQAERKKDLQKEKSSIQKELKALENKMDAQQDIDLLRELLKKFPSDAEE